MHSVVWSALWQSPKLDRLAKLGGVASLCLLPAERQSLLLDVLAGRGKLLLSLSMVHCQGCLLG